MTYNRDNSNSFKTKLNQKEMANNQQAADIDFQYKNYSLTFLKELISMNKIKGVENVEELIKEAKKLEEYVRPKESLIKTLS